MKTAIYIEDGVVQLVLTPQNDFEKNALASFNRTDLETEIMRGQFYDCAGGWTRQRNTVELVDFPGRGGHQQEPDQSLILRIEPAKVKTAPQERAA